MKNSAAAGSSRRDLLWDIIFACLFIAACIFVFWKCRYGFGNIDEALYVSIPYRVSQGDGLFIHEWHLSQMTALMILPFMKIYQLAGGTGEGMILAFRYIFTGILAAASLFIYFRLRGRNRPGACAAALAFLLYAPYGIMALSYNSLGILNLTLALVIICTAKRAVRLQQAASGLFFAMAVLACPYLLLLYAVYIVAVIIRMIIFKTGKHRSLASDNNSSDDILTWKTLFFFTTGAAVLAAVFAVLVLSRASVSDVINALPYIMQDPEHTSRGIIPIITGYIRSVLFVNNYSLYIYMITAAAFLVMIIDRRRRDHRLVYMLVSSVCAIALMGTFVLFNRYINFFMFPLNIMVPFIWVLSDDRYLKRLAAFFWLPGMIYTFCIQMSSNQQFYAISSASAVALVPSLVMIGRFASIEISGYSSVAEESYADKHNSVLLRIIITAVCAVLLAAQLVTLGYMRYKSVFWENMKDSVIKIDRGPSRGVYTSVPIAEDYYEFLDAADEIRASAPDAGSILFFSERTWGYLVMDDLRNASYASWLSIAGYADEALTRLLAYYELNEDKIPDLIYIEDVYSDCQEALASVSDYRSLSLSNGAILLIRNR